MSKKIAIVLTSSSQVLQGEEGPTPTGFWWEELAAPYAIFTQNGYDVDIFSVAGGPSPADPASEKGDAVTAHVHQFQKDDKAMKKLRDTQPIADIKDEDYCAIFLAGGHGTCFDFTKREVGLPVEKFFGAGKGVAAVCHGPVGLTNAMHDGKPIITEKKVTGFSNDEEIVTKKGPGLPFLLEDKLKSLNAHYSCGPQWQSHVVVDGNLITGQNPASSVATAESLVQFLKSSS
eukprot:m.138609 g.138609  ORF g.138609 m.138609 type:complete len:232 (-) comp20275_c1_seq1:81-776(-)